MFSTIVVGTDGSETAQRAVDLAVDLARQPGTTLVAVHAYRVRSGTGPSGAAPPAADESLQAGAARESAEAVLRAVAERADGIQLRTRCLEGSPAETLLQAAEEEGADLIVVGSKGMQGTRGRLLGSVPNSVAHHAGCHVLIAKTA